ncbi:meiotic activator rim4 [Fusarium flagelliforme]|uniref:Meiotic activator rim4 n=1 Tax=Fusarium flagelliforme TaxID=2675880 RepID=A0A395MC75_9HYPO|nr:meiotic activator rim4 [Fusarium flagelliforme]
MSSPPEYRRPHDPATSERQQRSALAIFGIDESAFETQSDAGSPRGSPYRPLSNVKSLPTLPKTAYDSPEKQDDYDDSVKPQWEFVESNYGYVKDSVSNLTRPASFEDDDERNVEAVPSEDHTQLVESQAQTTTATEKSQHVANSNETFDAQAVYPAEACLFVANLSQAVDDRSIENELTKFFGNFGTVFVKVKRDRRLMPYAFAQFTERKHADFALEKAWGESIMGRKLRLEKCGGSLAYIIFRRNNRPVQREEAQNIFARFGKIAKIEPLSPQIQSKLSVPPSLLVQYEKFDPRRDVVKSFGLSNVFMIMSYDPKIGQDRSERAPGDQTFMEHYDRDRRSIFMGNLPPHADEALVHRLTSLCGEVTSVDLRKDPSIHGGTPNVYAFVEFDRPDAPDEAIRQFSGTHVEGSILRVERKRTKPTRDVRSFSQSLHPEPLSLPMRPHRRAASSAVAPLENSNFYQQADSVPVAPTNPQTNHGRALPMPPAPAGVQTNHNRMLSTAGLSPIPWDIIATSQKNERANHQQGVMPPAKGPMFDGTGLDEFTPIQSPEKVGVPNYMGNNVHWGPSRFVEASPVYVLSPTDSSPEQPCPNKALLKSFADRMTAPERSISYAFSPAADFAADRCKIAIEDEDDDAVKGHRRGPSALFPVPPALDVSDSEGSSDWRTPGTAEEEIGFKRKKAKVRSKLRRSHLSEQNLKRNELVEKRYLKEHKSAEALQAKKASTSKKDAVTMTEDVPLQHASGQEHLTGVVPYQGAQVQTQMPPQPAGGFVYFAVPVEQLAAHLTTNPQFNNYPAQQPGGQYQAPPQVQQLPQASYQAPGQPIYGDSALTNYQAPSQTPFHGNIQNQYQGYAQASYGDGGPVYRTPQVQYQNAQQVHAQSQPQTAYPHPQQYRAPLPMPQYVGNNHMAPTGNLPMPSRPAETYHQMPQRSESKRYNRYNGPSRRR